MKYHKHKGVMSKGKLKSHPMEQKHKDKYALNEHNKEVLKLETKTSKTTKPKITNDDTLIQFIKKQPENISFDIDGDGYIFVDLDKTNVKGMKLVFTRTEFIKGTKTRRTVALQFENLPAEPGRFTNGKYSLRKTY